MPAGQGCGKAAPDTQNEPAGQSAQTPVVPDDVMNVPAAHKMQAATVVEPVSGLYEPPGHDWHASWPVSGLKVPDGQSGHVFVPDTSDAEPAAHGAHSTAPGADA